MHRSQEIVNDTDLRYCAGDRLLVAKYSLPLRRVLVLRDKPRLGTWLPNVPFASITMSANLTEALCPRVCGCFRCVVGFTVDFPRTLRFSPFRSMFSFLPPSTTLRGYQRQSLATTASELGSVYCSIVSYATSSHMEDFQKVIGNLIAIRLKLKRSIVVRANIIYEVCRDLHEIFLLSDEVVSQFSLRGRWPAKRYQKILEIQLYAQLDQSEIRSFAHWLFLAR